MAFWSRILCKNGVYMWCVFFPPSLIRTGFFKKEMEIFNQLVNDFCTKILKTYCLFSEDYVNCSGN